MTAQKKKWCDLSPRARRLIIVGATVEGVLKIAALTDLARRPAAEVRGSKRGWAIALCLISSVGVLPLGYFVFGRRSNGSTAG